MDETQPLIHTQLATIIGELPGIGKDSKAGQGQFAYNYRGIEDILPHIKSLFAKHEVHVVPGHSIVSDESGQGNKGNQRRVVLQSTFCFYAADGSFCSATTIGEAMDTQDKAMNKAMTASYKYALMQVLAIADGDDPDAHQPNQQTEQAPPPEPTESWKALVALGDQLKANSVSDQVKEWARENGVNIADRTADVSAVVTYAETLLANVAGNKVAESFGATIEDAEVVE